MFELIYTLLGGLGIFFLGLNILSEGLQNIAGDFVRRAISALTTNRVMAVLVGTFVTVIIQSSSITTVTVVSLANAGLIKLTQAIGVVFGANIGTTITGWIIAIKVGKYGLLFVGLGAFPMLFSKRPRFKNIGRVLMALGFIFMGLQFMSGAFKPLRTNEAFLSALQYFTADNYLSLIACIGVGMLLTFVIQSSSAMLGITIALALAGSITYQTAVALVLGENIGTTITALIASIGANTEARRTARAHALFNCLGVLAISLVFWQYLGLVDWLVEGKPDMTLADGTKPGIATHIAAAHTIFNVTVVFLLLPFINSIAKLVIWLTPAKEGQAEEKTLKYLTPDHGASPALALGAAEQEVEHLSAQVFRMLRRTKSYLLSEQNDPEERKRISDYEDRIDHVQKDITVYVCQTQEAALSPSDSHLSHAIIRTADELESIADYCERLAAAKDRLTEANEELTDEAKADLEQYFEQVIEYYSDIQNTIGHYHDSETPPLSHWHDRLSELKSLGNTLRTNHQKRLEENKCSALSSIFFSDMMVALRKIKSHTINIAQAYADDNFIMDV